MLSDLQLKEAQRRLRSEDISESRPEWDVFLEEHVPELIDELLRSRETTRTLLRMSSEPIARDALVVPF
jgi:hypothetical protein